MIMAAVVNVIMIITAGVSIAADHCIGRIH